MNQAIEIATKLIKLNEGCKLEVYTCPAGYKTFGYGTNLETSDAFFGVGLDYLIKKINNCKNKETLAVDLLQLEIINCKQALSKHSWFTDNLSEFQKSIFLDLAYNIGVAGVLKFHNMIEAIKQHNYGIACTEMLDSKYHYQMICFGYKDELAADIAIDITSIGQVLYWWCELDNDYKQLRSASNALSLQFDKPLGKYKGMF